MAQTQSAYDYAKQQLGDLDLSHLDRERDVAQKTYDTSKSSLENNFNNLLKQIESNRSDTRKNFNTGRATVAENSYNANRLNQADLASRGVGSSGLKALGEVGNRMETGRQYSNLANDFYSSMNELKTTEDQGRSQYDIDQRTIQNTLDNTLAGIDSRAGEAKNNYNMTLGQLAESVQGRWDANDNAQKALAQAKAAAHQAHLDAQSSIKQSLKTENAKTLSGITNLLGKDNGKGGTYNIEDLSRMIQTAFGVDSGHAISVLDYLGIGNSHYSPYGPNLNGVINPKDAYEGLISGVIK